MKFSNTERARVSQQCKSAESKLVLTGLVIRRPGKGKKVNIPLLSEYARRRKADY